MSDNNEVFPPQPVAGAIVRNNDLTGFLFPWHAGAPALVTLPGSDDFFLPVFSTLEKLQAMVQLIELPMDSVKQIDHPIEFFESIPASFDSGQRLRIIVDPYRTDDNKTKFAELLRAQ